MKAKSTAKRGGTSKPLGKQRALQLRYSQEEIDFLEAIERYKREKGRPFPTWSEVLEVLRGLGYVKKERARETDRDNKHWQELCNDLREERDQLSLELAKVKAERDQYLKAVYALTWEDIELPDKKTMFAQMVGKPSFEELISELESRGAK